ncbi:iron-containing alcohol dehydrogenase [Clostridium sp. CS001]|uniref:iron-containing alcohol dehydrogenase n=1 Tax=Clostridium sp. CS001 TaxID=2880648 RepID=UPI001CF1865D|nr:iron-containing alcohol dehydrogenase [Clostridium sp. CS001]MCB2289347.1 iron-containing alcohol dehydrogenase [Clostridium sp. CS001]
MNNFNYSIPTKIFFGKNKINILGEEIKKYGSRVLLVYGGGSIKKSGIYDKIAEIFKANDISFWELSGVEPNPRITSVKKGIQLCRENKIDIILAVGGGSSIDCAKVVAAGYYYEGDAWDIVIDPRKIENALPLATILTLAATGSEMNSGAVITNIDTNEKLGTGNPAMAPKFSILDPTYTYTLPTKQTAAGTADIISHIFEVYFSSTNEAYLQNRMAEAMLKTCIKYGEIAIKEPENYEARSNLMWTSSLAINGLLSYGKVTEWSTHGMEHELSAYYDITHGVGLAILTPHWMKYILNEETLEKFVEYGVNVWGIDAKKDKYEIANEAIDKTREYFNSLGIPSSLKEVGINEERLEEMAKQATRRGKLGNFRALDSEDVLNIFKASL